MRKSKNSLSKEVAVSIPVDPSLQDRYGDGVLFQHKVDRLRTLLKSTKLDLTIATPPQKA